MLRQANAQAACSRCVEISNGFYKLTGVSLLALGMTVAPVSSGLVYGQDNQSAPATTLTEDTAGENFQDSGEALGEAAQEAGQGVEAAGETAQENLQDAAQNASQAAQNATQAAEQAATEAAQDAAAAAEQAELAAENAAENIQESSNWGWLGLLGLVGLFGLAGGNKRRVETDERYRQTNTPATSDYR